MGAQLVKITRKKDRTLVSVHGAMTVANAAELKERFLEAFAPGRDVELSLGGVTEIDATGLQLLCSCHRTSVERGMGFKMKQESESLVEVARTAGMYRLKGCVVDEAGTCIWLEQNERVRP